jgi:hypothetical protein
VSCLKCLDYDVEWKKFLIDESQRFTSKKKNTNNTTLERQHQLAANEYHQGTNEPVSPQYNVPRRRRPGRPRQSSPTRQSPTRQSGKRVPRLATVKRHLRAAGLDSDFSDISEPEDEDGHDIVEREEEVEVETLLGL